MFPLCTTSPVIIIILIICNQLALYQSTPNKRTRLTAPANFLLPLLQRRGQRIRHTTSAGSPSWNTGGRQPAAVRPCIAPATTADIDSAAVADLGAVDLLERGDTARAADAVEHGRAGLVASRW